MEGDMGTSPTIPEQYANQQVGISGYRVLNLDLDGVCADYAGAMRDYLVRTGRMDPQTIPANTRYALTDNDGWPFASKSEYITAHKAAEEEHLYATMQPIPGVAHALQRSASSRTGCSYPGSIASSSPTPPNGSTTTTSLTCRSASPG